MKTWILRCSVCGREFERETPVAPVLSEVAPPHTWPDGSAPCIGEGQLLILHEEDNR